MHQDKQLAEELAELHISFCKRRGVYTLYPSALHWPWLTDAERAAHTREATDHNNARAVAVALHASLTAIHPES